MSPYMKIWSPFDKIIMISSPAPIDSNSVSDRQVECSLSPSHRIGAHEVLVKPRAGAASCGATGGFNVRCNRWQTNLEAKICSFYR